MNEARGGHGEEASRSEVTGLAGGGWGGRFEVEGVMWFRQRERVQEPHLAFLMESL